jgi:cell wall assembly regulator SMI1
MNAAQAKLFWDYVDDVLARKAPVAFAALRPGASMAQVELLEHGLGVTLPDEVRFAYLRHDGQDATKPGNFLLFITLCHWAPLDDVQAKWRFFKEISDEHRVSIPEVYPEYTEWWDDLVIHPHEWSPKWIPVGISSTPTAVSVDLQPGPKGNLGQLISDDLTCEGAVMAPSFNAYFQRLCDYLESGLLVHNPDEGFLEASSGLKVFGIFPEILI